MRLELLQGGRVVHAVPIEESPIRVGRSSKSDLILAHPGVSGHHALIFAEGGQVRLRDLGSTNGTLHNGARVVGEVELGLGDLLLFGTHVQARITGDPAAAAVALRLELVGGPVAWAVDRRRFPIPVEGDATLLVGEDCVQLALDGQEREVLTLDEPFEVRGRRLVLRADEGAAATLRPEPDLLPYTLEVALSRSRAWLRDGERACALASSTRVSLLHVLGRAWQRGEAGPGRGWVEDDEAGVGVWGRASRAQDPNNLNVLVHRIRRQVERAGLDRWFIERERGRLRLRVAEVQLRG